MRLSVVPIGILAIATLGATLVGCTSAAGTTTTSSSTTTTTTAPEFTQSNVTVLVDHGGSVIDPVCDSDDTLAHVDGSTGEWGHTVLGPGTLEDGPQEDRRGMQVCRHHVVFDGFPIPEDAFLVIDGISYTRVRPDDPGHYDCARWVKHFLYSNDYSLDTTPVCDIEPYPAITPPVGQAASPPVVSVAVTVLRDQAPVRAFGVGSVP